VPQTAATHTLLPLVIVPVHNAFECVKGCLESLQRCSPEAEVLVVDDASTDARIRPLLEQWCAASPQRALLALPQNLGFVGAVNRGIERAPGDVVLLNSDTVVTRGWLQALARCLASAADIATATPWSNNAEITSVPEFCQANPVPEDAERWARASAAVRPLEYPELPTAVGFCMAISATAISQVGLFDEQAFGRGYGEENDFSLRARAAGLRNVLCVDAYVVHRGGQSFGPLGLQPDEQSMQRLLAKHPAYLEGVMEWIGRDPLAPWRARLLSAYAAAE
jgi:GT2 family glycosyltransferase